MPELEEYAEQVIHETAYFIWKREALSDTCSIIGGARLSKRSDATDAAVPMSSCRMRKRSLPGDQTRTCPHFFGPKMSQTTEPRPPLNLSGRLHMEGFAQTLSVSPSAASTAELSALTSPSLRRRGAHADPREPTDRLSQHKPTQWRRRMADSVYKVVEVVGTSNESISKAIGRAISEAGATLRHLGWFEVVQIRGSIENDQIRQ